MQEKINGFQKVTQRFNGTDFSSEINGTDVKLYGPNYVDVIGTVKVNGLVNGYGPYHPMYGVQPIYECKMSNTLTVDTVGDSVTIFDGSSSVPSLNPFKRLFGDDYQDCVIWPVEAEIQGCGFDTSNYLDLNLVTTGTNWLYNNSTYTIRHSFLYSFTNDRGLGTNIQCPLSYDTKITTSVDSLSTVGTPGDNDKKFTVFVRLICQKINQ